MRDATGNEVPFPDAGDLEARSGRGICDFCTHREPTAWVYPCKSFRMPIPDLLGDRVPMSEGAWGACEECAALIEVRDIRGLVNRMEHDHPVIRRFRYDTVRLFFANRFGEREADSPPEVVRFDEVLIAPDDGTHDVIDEGHACWSCLGIGFYTPENSSEPVFFGHSCRYCHGDGRNRR